jgi:hypothetical protein
MQAEKPWIPKETVPVRHVVGRKNVGEEPGTGRQHRDCGKSAAKNGGTENASPLKEHGFGLPLRDSPVFCEAPVTNRLNVRCGAMFLSKVVPALLFTSEIEGIIARSQ